MKFPWERITPDGYLQSAHTPGATDGKHNHLLWDLAYITECQLATVEDLKERTTFPQTQLARHRRIAEFCVDTCKLHGVAPQHCVEATRLAFILGFKEVD